MSKKRVDWDKAIELYKQRWSYKEIAEELNCSVQTLKNRRLSKLAEKKINQISEDNKVVKDKVEFEDIKVRSKDNIAEFIKIMKLAKKAHEKIDTKQIETTVRIDDDKPVAIALTSDWHVGCMGTNYERLEEDLELIRDTSGMYVVGLGDYKDNYIRNSPPGGQYQQIIQPGTQDQVVVFYMSIVADKLIALIRGCHDHWDARHGDRDFISALCSEFDCVNLWHGGALRIKLGNQEYLFRLRHKYKYQSSLNLENAMRRLVEQQGPCDVAFEAHLHNPYLMYRTIGEREVILGRTGSYKQWDDYGQQIGGFKGIHGVPIVILWPDQHKLLAFHDLEMGARVLTDIRENF